MRLLAWLRRRWWLVLIVVGVTALLAWLMVLLFGAIADRQAYEREGESVRDEVVVLARTIEAQNALILSVTGPEVQARSAATLKRAIDDIRRSIDCAELDDEGKFPACADVVSRLDAIRAGLDPFAEPPPTTGAP